MAPSKPAAGQRARRLLAQCALAAFKTLLAIYDLVSAPAFLAWRQAASGGPLRRWLRGPRRRPPPPADPNNNRQPDQHPDEQQDEWLEEPRGAQLEPRDPGSAWRQINVPSSHRRLEAQIDAFETYHQMMEARFALHGSQPCYGFRRLLHHQPAPGGKPGARQVRLADYRWLTFDQFQAQIEAARAGLLLEGVRPGHRVMLYADTRPEWQIASQALIRLGAVVVTMYSTLGIDGVLHSLNETQVSHVVAQRDKLGRLLELRHKLPHLRKLVYLDEALCVPVELGGDGPAAELHNKQDSSQPSHGQLFGQVQCLSFERVLAAGLTDQARQLVQQVARDPAHPPATKDSLAVIMYTSGSTGVPKGVLISHRNIMATIKSFSHVTKDFVHRPRENTATAYLPLAHIFEFCIESMMLYHGVKFGFASPHTLTDKSPGLLQPGQRGDLSLLRPTVLIIVPLILDRIVLGVKQALEAESYLKSRLVQFLIQYKISWQQRHYATPLTDRLVCAKIAAALGGRAKYVICGSAPLAPDTQRFCRAALNLQLPQGFGTTETCAATSCQLFRDQSTGNVGLPVTGALIKLEAWREAGYTPEDKPNPRGEIVVGGDMIAMGYFKLDDQTKAAFYTDSEGVRWYRTGDIGEFLPSGSLKIIDRKKDLVKLQNGEYISLGRVESTLKSNPYLENFCVYANSAHNYVVALGPANEQALRQLAGQLLAEHRDQEQQEGRRKAAGQLNGKLRHRPEGDHGDQSEQGEEAAQRRLLLAGAQLEELRELLASYESDKLNNNNHHNNNHHLHHHHKTPPPGPNERLERLCANPLLTERVLAHLHQLGRQRHLLGLELPRKLLLLADEWTEDSNLVTAAMKIRRNYIYKRYERRLAQLYQDQA